MDILHVFINEYDTPKDLEQALKGLDELCNYQWILASNNKDAERKLISKQDKRNNLKGRIFYTDKSEYKGNVTYRLFECLKDENF